MEEKTCVFWAKKKLEHGRYWWLPLSQHLTDTQNMMGLLWEHWLSEGQKNLVAASLGLESPNLELGKNLALFLGAVHDIGKATPAFQTKEGYSKDAELDNQLLAKLESVGFKGISQLDLPSPSKSPHNLAGQYLLSTYGVKEDIASIIGGHHGKPIDLIQEVEEQKSYLSNYFQHEKVENAVYQKWYEEQVNLFEWALHSSHFDSVSELPSIKQPAQVILVGLLIMSDWIASNEKFFPLLTLDEDGVDDQTRRLETGFLRWRKTSLWEPTMLGQATSLYGKRFNIVPRPVQLLVSQVIEEIEQPGVFILEAAMGGGKTEAALVAAEQLAAKTGRSGIFFGLPTQATSDGLFPRVERWVESISREGDAQSIQLVHGKAALNEEFAMLPKISINDSDEEINGSVVVDEWFSGRKTAILADFVIGTVDQFLMVALKQKHLALRHLGLTKKVVIIDEVHAYDAYMSQYLLGAIRWMGAYGVPVIILSATLPEQKRIDMIRYYLMGRGIKNKKFEIVDSLSNQCYPLVTYTDGTNVHTKTCQDDSHKKTVYVNSLSEVNLVETVAMAIQDQGVIGIIVNTVKRAQKIAKELATQFGEEVVELLHSGFVATERVRKEKVLLASIGKDGHRPAKKIIVGTQVLEQSLDIDFDVMISDLAPMDLLIQRMGRLQRHKMSRPSSHSLATFYVMGISDDLMFEEGSSFVYGDYLLARTQYFLPEVVQLPEDIPTLVQAVYDIEKPLTGDYEALEQMKVRYSAVLDMKKLNAKAFLLDRPVLKPSKYQSESLIGWLKNRHPIDNEEYANAQVRDIEDSIEVIALKKVSDGYGLFSDGKDLSHSIEDTKVAKEIAKQTLRLPLALSKHYNIDGTIIFLEQYNNEHLSQWRHSPWLKGALGIIFDDHQEFIIGSFKLKYDEKYGITIERMNNNESV